MEGAHVVCPRVPVGEATTEEAGGAEHRRTKERGPVKAKAPEQTGTWWRRDPLSGFAEDVAVWPRAAGTQQKERGDTKSRER